MPDLCLPAEIAHLSCQGEAMVCIAVHCLQAGQTRGSPSQEVLRHLQQPCRLGPTLMVDMEDSWVVVWLYEKMPSSKVWKKMLESNVHHSQLLYIDVFGGPRTDHHLWAVLLCHMLPILWGRHLWWQPRREGTQPMDTPGQVRSWIDMPSIGALTKRYCCDTFSFQCLFPLASKWKLFNYLYRGHNEHNENNQLRCQHVKET